jgi:hypothetical protein
MGYSASVVVGWWMVAGQAASNAASLRSEQPLECGHRHVATLHIEFAVKGGELTARHQIPIINGCISRQRCACSLRRPNPFLLCAHSSNSASMIVFMAVTPPRDSRWLWSIGSSLARFAEGGLCLHTLYLSTMSACELS